MRSIAILSLAAAAVAIPIVAPVDAVVDAVANVVAPIKAAAANIDIQDSAIGNNILNDNTIKVASRETPSIQATIQAIVDAVAKVNAPVNAAVGNVQVSDSSIGDNIANGNKIKVASRSKPDVLAPVQALIKAAISARVPVQAALANIGIDCSEILTGVLDGNKIKVARDLDIVAIVKAIADACAEVGVDVYALIANINISDSYILTDILNGNYVDVLRRDDLTTITGDVLSTLESTVTAALNAGVDVTAAVANIGLDCVSILSNIGNNNDISVLRRDASKLDIVATVVAVVDALVNAGVPVDVNALNAYIQNSGIATDILNKNIIKIVSS